MKIGFVSPQTGPIAAFGEADKFVLDGVRKAIGNSIKIAGADHPVQIIRSFLEKLRISPEAGFSINDWTVIFMVVIGGIGTLEGPIIGMFVYFILRELLADYGSWYLIVLGLVAVLVMLKAREGLWGLIARRFNVQLFPVRRHLVRKNAP